MKRVIYFLLILTSTAFGQSQNDTVYKPEVKNLLDSALPLMRSGELEKCLLIYERIVSIDSMSLVIYGNKEFFERKLKRYDKALITAKRMMYLMPNDTRYTLLTGLLYDRINDSLNGRKYFEKTITLCNKILDTLKTDEEDILQYLKLQKALAIFFSGDEVGGNKLLMKLARQQNLPSDAGGIHPYLNKSREDLIKIWLGEK
jgi:tetratricopeptide (TPR) repeat protein